MSKLSFAAMVAVIGLAGCTSQKPAEEPEDGPAGVEFEYQGDEVAEEESDEDSATESDEGVAQSEEKAGESDPSSASSKDSDRGSSKASCSGREQKLCEVSVGCAWSTTKECVDQ